MYLGSLSEPDMRATVDKLSFHTPSFSVAKGAQLIIKPQPTYLNGNTCNRNGYLFTDAYKQPQYGQKAYLNIPERVNLTISNFKGTPYCSVTINPNKLYHSYKAVDSFDMTISAIESINYDLKQYGIEVDFSTSSINRLDLMKQQHLPDSLMAHHSIFESMAAKWQKRRTFNQTYIFGNNQHQTNFYDKSDQLKLDKKNLVRCEIRASKKSSVSAVFGIKNLYDLFEISESHLNKAYNTHLTNKVFGDIYSNHNFSSIYEVMKYYVGQYGQSGVQKCLMAFGVLHLQSEFNFDRIIGDVILNSGSSTSSAKRWGTKSKEMHRELSSIMDSATSDHARLFQNILSFAS
jgi:hypothetical protein